MHTLITKSFSSPSEGPPKKPSRESTVKCFKLFAFHRIYIIYIKLLNDCYHYSLVSEKRPKGQRESPLIMLTLPTFRWF